jgi:Uncharacterized conserved protein
MKETRIVADGANGIPQDAMLGALSEAIADERNALKKVLLIPPDMTRMHSGAGQITAMLYGLLKDTCTVDILPALGTHEPMSAEEIAQFFGVGIPESRFAVHNWRTSVQKIGEVPASYVAEVSGGLFNEPITVEINRMLLDRSYDRIISIGQVVPHEVAGMANYTKNVLVGCGGKDMIDKSHMLGAVFGMERMMGRDHSPVRDVFDYAEQHFLADIPLSYVLTVTTEKEGRARIHGLFAGRRRGLFEQAVALSQQLNLTFVEKRIQKIVVYLDEAEFKSTWLGNKAIYRTRMAVEDGGELLILAPGVSKFGEDTDNDALIRKYGYVGRDRVLALCAQNEDLRSSLSVAAHLVHGSSDGRFSVTYAVRKLTREEVEGAGFRFMDYDGAVKKYDPNKLENGYNTLEDGEEVFYISNPALGLWAYRKAGEEFQ